jgi:hypothetical protein
MEEHSVTIGVFEEGLFRRSVYYIICPCGWQGTIPIKIVDKFTKRPFPSISKKARDEYNKHIEKEKNEK